MPVHADLPAPDKHGIGLEIRAIASDNRARLATFRDEIGRLQHEPVRMWGNGRQSPVEFEQQQFVGSDGG